MGFRKADMLLPILVALFALSAIAQTIPTPAHSQPQGDPVQDLVQRSERAYLEGERNYAAGHLEAAKQAFDRAVTILLESPYDLRSNALLANQLDRKSTRLNSSHLVIS